MTPAATAARAAARRPFSVLTSLRTAARSSPFPRPPTSQKAARPDWAREFKRAGSQALVFFPGFAVLLGWPFLAKSLVDGHV
ncbi:hypothetical protein G6O67_001011 [Ophiocordyceps sinensis]|uniref:Pantothenate transporter liz1 n=1 Tax=Ophiocordyceps sinensis TaxID=72228 RepID=A0A8H4PWQ5_9HYPO|nr:hypothetical protein G6O67_001011 [Ophiocordyceps sinensis]